ncbi:oligopeptide transporter [Stachybotrys elegans]|uniref:Oligopeptide transporter n=1 Tax=Stachybotrys elegans TaxID=80388 RepID=A0A8K0SYQ5_9HYPO|nr:oligopeptide transporter [Stachybotrys elegans]
MEASDITVLRAASFEEAGKDEYPRKATPEEIRDLVHEVDDIPVAAWLLTFTGAASNLAKFGITVTWQNYLQNEPGNPLLPGALGLGQSTATAIQSGYLFFRYLAPLPFAIISDAWLGRHTTMHISLGLLLVGYTVLVLTSIPSALERGAGLPGLIVTMFLTGLGHGGLSAVMYPFIADQIPEHEPRVKRNKKGELVVTERQLSVQYVFNGYYWMVNVASMAIIATTLLERHVGFWLAFLVPTGILFVTIIPVIVLHRRLVKLPPEGNILIQAGQVIMIACRSKFRLDAADPMRQKLLHDRDVPWTSAFVDEMRRGLKGCRVILFFIIFWLCYDQTTTNIISQAAQMRARGISNDTIQALNPVACIIMGPLIQDFLFKFLRENKIAFGPIIRMTVAFFFTAAAIAYAAGIQQVIYSSGPCYEYPLECPAATPHPGSNERLPNNVNIWLQTPYLFILAIGEILGMVALNEYTYTEAPTNLKAMVQALQNLSAAAGAAIGIALGQVSRNPWLVILFSSLAGVMTIFAVLFWLIFHKYDGTEPAQQEGNHEAEGED